MAVIKTVSNSTAFDNKFDELSQVSRPAQLQMDHMQAMASIQKAIKKAAEELANEKRHKKPAKQLPIPVNLAMMLTKLPPDLLLGKLHLSNGGGLQKPWISSVVPATPVTDGLTQPELRVEASAKNRIISPDERMQKQKERIATSKEADLTAMPSLSLEQENAISVDPSLMLISSTLAGKGTEQQPRSTLPQVVEHHEITPALPSVAGDVAIDIAIPESERSLNPLVEQKEPGDKPTPLVTSPVFSSLSSQTVPATEIKPEPQTLPEALAEPLDTKGGTAPAEGGVRTLSYTFNQWPNRPMVTFTLPTGSELIAITDSADVRQALQENQQWLTTENTLHFRYQEHDQQHSEHDRQGSEHQQQAEQEEEK